jgi:hypothetical protein
MLSVCRVSPGAISRQADKLGSTFVVIVNQSLARSLFGDANPLGRTIRFTQDKDSRPFEIIGVVGDSHYYDVHVAPQPALWFAFQDYAAPYMSTLHIPDQSRRCQCYGGSWPARVGHARPRVPGFQPQNDGSAD